MCAQTRQYNGSYTAGRLARVAFPMGGIGAGMICLEGTGALSHVSVRNRPDVFNEPMIFAALCVRGEENITRILEGPVPRWKVFGPAGAALGGKLKTYGLPRFEEAVFTARFPFATVELRHARIPLKACFTGWSPFIPNNSDDSSLPMAVLEYAFENPGVERVSAVFSFHAHNFMAACTPGCSVGCVDGGFVLRQSGSQERPEDEGTFSVVAVDPVAKVDCAWFRGGWYDPLTMLWKAISEGRASDQPPPADGDPSPGGSVYVPFTLEPQAKCTIRLILTWYVPKSNIREGPEPEEEVGCSEGGSCCGSATKRIARPTYVPWYAGRFESIEAVVRYARQNLDRLLTETMRFTECFYDTSLPSEVVEAVAANLTILKSPTVLRQTDGRMYCWEGCSDDSGCCGGSCTHVWNYAQAMPHLFPELERGLRGTEFWENQDEEGHQDFRASLPIRPTHCEQQAAADGQLGGIMKMHREWRISGDTDWLRRMWPSVRASLDYCIRTWDPDGLGVLVEPHNNTYDIEFWGPNSMCSSFYLGALSAVIRMADALGEDASDYRSLLEKGRRYLEEELYDGEYFFQKVMWKGLRAGEPAHGGAEYSPEAVDLMSREGPKYQYGRGCLSDGVLGAWVAVVCGLEDILDPDKVKSHLLAVHRYNLKKDLSDHANPQRPTYAVGKEGGLLLCSWPKGGRLSLPFVYSNEVWTGVEYQVASHLMMVGCVEEGLDIVRTARDRYDGSVRNPFDEYECGHWYARAMSSYAMLQGLSGARYDAVDKTLILRPAVKGDFRAFLSTATGYGTVGVRDGKPFIDIKHGSIDIERIEFVEPS